MFRRFYTKYPRLCVDCFCWSVRRAQAPSSQPDLGNSPRRLRAGSPTWYESTRPIRPEMKWQSPNIFSGYFQKEASRMKLSKLRGTRRSDRPSAGRSPTGRGECAAARCASGHRGRRSNQWSLDRSRSHSRGYLYGKGRSTTKAMLAANLAIVVALTRTGVRLGRDVIFLATAAEEQGASASIKVRHREILGQDRLCLCPE